MESGTEGAQILIEKDVIEDLEMVELGQLMYSLLTKLSTS